MATDKFKTINQDTLNALVDDLKAKDAALDVAAAANDTAQSDAQAAIAAANSARVAKDDAHNALSASIQALVDYVKTLA